MLPSRPVANLIVDQTRFTMGSLDASVNAMFRPGNAGKTGQLCFGRSVQPAVISPEYAPVIAIASHHQHLWMALAPTDKHMRRVKADPTIKIRR